MVVSRKAETRVNKVNIIGMVGTVVSMDMGSNSATVILRVARPFISEVEYDQFSISVNPKIFKAELSAIKTNETVAFKGRAESDGAAIRLVAERLMLI